MACSPGVQLRTRFGGFRYLFSGKGGFFLEVSGTGDLFYNSYGAVVEKTLDGTLTVDTGHVVAWDPSLEYTVGGMGGIKQTLFSGEGLVMKFSGRGKLQLQTRTLSDSAGGRSRGSPVRKPPTTRPPRAPLCRCSRWESPPMPSWRSSWAR